MVATALKVAVGVDTNGLVACAPGVLSEDGVPVNLALAMAVAVCAMVITFWVGSENAKVAVASVGVDAERKQPGR